MKKLLSILATFILLFTVVGCGKKDEVYNVFDYDAVTIETTSGRKLISISEHNSFRMLPNTYQALQDYLNSVDTTSFVVDGYKIYSYNNGSSFKTTETITNIVYKEHPSFGACLSYYNLILTAGTITYTDTSVVIDYTIACQAIDFEGQILTSCSNICYETYRETFSKDSVVVLFSQSISYTEEE